MKKLFIGLFAALILFFNLIPHSDYVAYATDNSENLEDVVNNTLDKIDFSGFEDLISSLTDENFSFLVSARAYIDEILQGKAEPGFEYFFDAMIKIFFGSLKQMLPRLIIIVILAALYGVLANLNSGFMKASTQKIVYLAVYAFIITIIGLMITETVKKAVSTFNFMKKFVNVCFPVLITLVTALGGNAGAAIYQPYILIFSTVLMSLVTGVIMPLFYITFTFGIVGNLSDNLKLSKFSSTAKSISEWITGIVFGTFITLLTAQGITGAGIDGLAMKGAKYALSSYLPVIGGYIKDGFDIVTAGCVVIKNAVGLCALTILLVGILSPIIKILIMSFGLKIAAAIAEPISDGKIASLLNTVGESLKILVTAIICAGIALLIAIMLIIYTCNPGVL